MEPINLNRLAYFATVVDAGSFTRAAERLGITKTVVSQQVARLEAELQATLLVRTTRRLEPTEAGRRLHARCVLILRDVEEAVAEIGEANTEVAGVLRVSAPNDYGTIVVAPIAARFRQKFAACGVELSISDAKIDLIGNKIDLSIRVGWLEDSSQQARRIGTFQQMLVASRDFAAKVTVGEPEDLSLLPLVANAVLRKPFTWTFARGDGERRTITMREAFSINSTPAVLEATLAGGGLAILPDYLVIDHLSKGRLVHMLPNWSLPSGGIHVVYPAARFRPQKVTRFVSMLMQHIQD
ncbi:LysR family transcriptional regulator [Mesorhizobium erdmanii]|uniref:LysR family transcriptional regulator n=1 Tax=Mesorhizobium erdmanii TaxID=1777866 RepID=A0A6M7UFZ6_9HYPH|nr:MULTISPECIES: LysR family transcriptional regulator [Mesorhizobium]OBQ69898.1 LysR family transcriptional regulator [Mesorhizobium loti]QKC76204.1 LysR family transcriptional regulator [Mesorhizobium erdmanii]